ncbi:MAG TPA: hypothetical protein VIY72_14075 [Acidimicrobiales bacterium]
MKLVTLGIDDEGRSCVVNERQIETTPAIPGVSVMNLFSTIEVPPVAPPPGEGAFDDMGMVPGTMTWMIVDLEPYEEGAEKGLANEMHYNTTIELACLLEGSVHYELGVGTADLAPGDCVAMPGVDHATFAGPDGARMVSISIGLAPAG